MFTWMDTTREKVCTQWCTSGCFCLLLLVCYACCLLLMVRLLHVCRTARGMWYTWYVCTCQEILRWTCLARVRILSNNVTYSRIENLIIAPYSCVHMVVSSRMCLLVFLRVCGGRCCVCCGTWCVCCCACCVSSCTCMCYRMLCLLQSPTCKCEEGLMQLEHLFLRCLYTVSLMLDALSDQPPSTYLDLLFQILKGIWSQNAKYELWSQISK